MPTLDFKGKQFVHSHHLSVPFRELDQRIESWQLPYAVHRMLGD